MKTSTARSNKTIPHILHY